MIPTAMLNLLTRYSGPDDSSVTAVLADLRRLDSQIQGSVCNEFYAELLVAEKSGIKFVRTRYVFDWLMESIPEVKEVLQSHDQKRIDGIFAEMMPEFRSKRYQSLERRFERFDSPANA